MNLPEGMNIDMCINNRTNELLYHVTVSPELINRIAMNILDERIARAKVALPLCKHSKRKHQLTKLLSALEQGRARFADSLSTNLEGTD